MISRCLRASRAAFALTLLAAAAQAQKGLRTYDGVEARVKSNASGEVSKLVLTRIDRFCDVFQAFYDELGLEKRADNKIVARVFASYDEYAEFRDRDVGDKPWSAYFSSTLNAIVLYDDARDGSLKHTLFHECQHQYLARYTGHAPKWVNEGLSEYFEGWRVPDTGKVTPGLLLYDLIVLQTSLRKGPALSLEALIALPPADFVDFAKKNPEHHPTLHYATSWGLVYYFLEVAPDADKKLFRDYLGDLNAKGSKGAKASLAVADWKAFEDRWKKAILALVPKCETVEDHLSVAAGYRDDAQWANAIQSYEAALVLDPKAVGVRFWLGLSQKRKGDYEAAAPMLEAARVEDPKDPRPAYQLARIASGIDRQDATPDMELALKLAREALALAGDDAPGYMSFLARCQALDGDRAGAVATMQKVLSLVEKEDRAPYEALLAEFKKAPKK